MTRHPSLVLFAVTCLALLSAACASNLAGLASAPAAPPAPGPDVIAVVEKVKPATVLVQNLAVVPRDLARAIGTGEIPQGIGTGFIYDDEGHIITNEHVITGAQRLRVVLPPPDNRMLDARLLGADWQTDLALLKVEGEKLPTVPLGKSADIRVGQWVVAVGNALGLPGGPTVTAGVISALDREVPLPGPRPQTPGPVLYGVLQTDAAINQGNSGGPLVNLQGEVVGVNTAGAADANTIGFAVAIDAAMPIVDQLRHNGRVARGSLGIGASSLTQAQARALGVPRESGVLVVQVQPQGPAASAGIQEGDLLVQIGETAIDDRPEMEQVLTNRYKPGDTVPVTIVRDGAELTVSVQLGERPAA
jgi:S1-C subfamily serine protease